MTSTTIKVYKYQTRVRSPGEGAKISREPDLAGLPETVGQTKLASFAYFDFEGEITPRIVSNKKEESVNVHYRKIMRRIAFCFFVFTLIISASCNHKRKPNVGLAESSGCKGVLVGAIRWDAWSGGAVTRQVEQTLGPEKYHNRLPWFAKVVDDSTVVIDGNSQEVMDREIVFASEAGIDYWAFLHYPEPDSMSDALRQYLNSSQRQKINFCLILHNAFGVSEDQWPHELDRAMALLEEPGYQTVLKGRPLVYAFIDKGIFPVERFKEFIRETHEKNIHPYCVFMGWDPTSDYNDTVPWGFDAVSAYACDSADTTYLRLCQRVEDDYWKKAAIGNIPYVPLITTGWDKSPRKENPVSWELDHDYQQQNIFPTLPTPGEIALHLDNGLNFVKNNPKICIANTVIIYAWNEHDEGGWLSPTWVLDSSPDSDRLRAIEKILSKRN